MMQAFFDGGEEIWHFSTPTGAKGALLGFHSAEKTEEISSSSSYLLHTAPDIQGAKVQGGSSGFVLISGRFRCFSWRVGSICRFQWDVICEQVMLLTQIPSRILPKVFSIQI